MEIIICLILLLIYPIIYCGIEAKAATITEGAQRFRLDNGLTVIFKEDRSAPVVSIQIWVKTGSANETEEEAGITHLIEHMIFKGTPSRKTGEIARTIEASGGHINAYTSHDRTVYYVETASESFDTALDVLLDAVQFSVFDPTELAREKEVVLEEYRRSLDNPRRRMVRALMGLSFKKHPYKRPVIGYESTIRSFDRQAILAYMDRWYTPGNMVLVAVGDFIPEKALETVRTLIKNFPERAGQTLSRPLEPEQTSPRSIVLKDKVQQAYLDMSWHIPSLAHPHIPALDLLEIILGHGRSSRLYSRLKMDKNMVHGIDSGAYVMADHGLFSVNATLKPERLDNVIEAIAGEIARVTSEPVPETELARAKRIAEADYISDMEDMDGQARILAFFETMEGDMYKTDEYLELLKKVTAQDIMDVVIRYLRPENLSIAVMAPKRSDIVLTGQKIMDVFSQAPRSMSLPEPTAKEDKGASKITLPNGMRIIIKENHRLPLVSLRLAMLGGSRLETPEQSGISEFVSRMLTRGTKDRSASKISSTIESWAGELDGFSGRNSFGISAKFLTKDLYPGLRLLVDLIRNSTFPESEMEKVREDMLAGIRAKKDSPMPQLTDLFYKTIYRTHPYGRPMTGTVKSINSIKKSDLIEWYRTLAAPPNFVLAVVGDVREDELIGQVEDLFSDSGPSSFNLPVILPEPPLQKEREVHLERPGKQIHLMVGYLDADLKSPDNAVMTLIDTALSGQGGRLFMELRDKQSLAYSVTAFRRPGLETGVFGVHIACDPKKLPVARKGIFRELERLKDEGLTEQELEDAKRYLLGSKAIGLQTNGSQAMSMVLDELYGLGYDHLEQFISEIKQVSTEDIKRVARKILVSKGFTLATVGPRQ